MDAEALRRLIRDIPDFPKPGILFRDVTPLLLDGAALRAAVEAVAAPFQGARVERVLGIESRGFLLGPAVAMTLGVGFGLVRKQGKLPHEDGYDVAYNARQPRLEHADPEAAGMMPLLRAMGRA